MDPLLFYMFIGIFSPGPNNILSSTTSSRIGIKKTVPFMVGVLVGTSIVFIITGIVHDSFVDDISTLKRYIGYIGVFYMMYLAFKIATVDIAEDVKEVDAYKAFFKGIYLTFINPKIIIFGLAISSLLFEFRPSFFDYVALSMIMGILCFISVLLWGVFGHLFTKFFEKYLQLFNVAMATMMIFAAVLIVLDNI